MRKGHSRPEPNTSSRIAGTVCDGCPCLHVIRSTGRRLKSERYWCSRRHARVDPHAEECGWRGPSLGTVGRR